MRDGSSSSPIDGIRNVPNVLAVSGAGKRWQRIPNPRVHYCKFFNSIELQHRHLMTVGVTVGQEGQAHHLPLTGIEKLSTTSPSVDVTVIDIESSDTSTRVRVFVPLTTIG